MPTIEVNDNSLIVTTFVNATKNYVYGQEDDKVSEASINNIRELYHFGLSVYGRCINKMYIDNLNNDTVHIGYVFQKRVEYSDSNDTYLQETWISFHNPK